VNWTEDQLIGQIDKRRVREQSPPVVYSTEPVEIFLPFPPTTNGLFKNVPHRGRARSQRYNIWIRAALNELNRQDLKRVKGRVALSIDLEDSSVTRGDADNRIKAVADILVSEGIIEGDSKKIVRRIEVAWSENTRGCRVLVTPLEVA
jgi:Holliday junction resolvase RusA-like endonuclease